MKIYITEQHYKLILNESSKKDILISKLGFSEDNAEFISRICGPLSVWIGNKLIDFFIMEITKYGYDPSKDTHVRWGVMKKLNESGFVRNIRSKMTSIMDYIRVGLNNDASSIKNLTFSEIEYESIKWHESLNVGEGNIDYVENHPIIRDYRKNGIGFYWSNLETYNSSEECDRMGHCGRTDSYNYLISLRDTKPIGINHTINKSHLTSAIGKHNGLIYQMKGQKNSKPNERYHPYILDLLLTDKSIKGFGSEYDSARDFKISDLGEDSVKKLYNVRPDLFKGRREQRLLVNMGIIDKPIATTNFILTAKPKYVSNYIDGDYAVGKHKDANGNTIETHLFETILSGDIWEIYDSNSYDGDWQGALEYNTNEENTLRITEMVRIKAEEEDIDISDMSLDNAIDELDLDEIQNALRSALTDAEGDSYYNMVHKKLKDCLEEYGNVTEMDDSGITIEINLSTYLDELDDESIDDYFERCNDNLECVFDELLSDGTIDKPKFWVDDRWSPDVDEENFNEMLSERLNDIS